MSESNNVDAVAYDHWKTKAQAGELEFHVQNKPRPNDDSDLRDREIYEAMGFAEHQFSDEVIVDIGAGSHLRTRFFTGAKIAAIEPLGNQYMENIDWCDLREAEQLHSIPAEQRVESLANSAAFANCMNVLDHTFQPERILSNVFFYLQPRGYFLLSVDLHDGQGDDLHPVDLTVPKLRELIEEAGFQVERAYLYLPRARSYGHGYACSYVLKKGDAATPAAEPFEFQQLRTPSQLMIEDVNRRANSIRRRVWRILSGESRGVRKLLGRAA